MTRRTLGTVREAIEALEAPAERAHRHLVTAWALIARREPDPTGTYREAVRAVEAAAKPVVSPNDNLATLGRIIGTIRANPGQWEFVLGEPSAMVAMAESLWRGQHDRHGTDDPEAPLNVTQQEADAALYLAVALVRFFSGGAFTARAAE